MTIKSLILSVLCVHIVMFAFAQIRRGEGEARWWREGMKKR